ncbi:hypothetical protein ACLOJK_022657 [Asimina triloba]
MGKHNSIFKFKPCNCKQGTFTWAACKRTWQLLNSKENSSNRTRKTYSIALQQFQPSHGIYNNQQAAVRNQWPKARLAKFQPSTSSTTRQLGTVLLSNAFFNAKILHSIHYKRGARWGIKNTKTQQKPFSVLRERGVYGWGFSIRPFGQQH